MSTTEPTHPTELNATQRDALKALVAADEGRGTTTVTEVRSIVVQASERVQENRTGTFYRALEGVAEAGFADIDKAGAKGTTSAVTVTDAGFDAYRALTEPSGEESDG